jgi:hypothetical protein
MAVSMGADTRTLMARMGHASARAALMYQHAQSDQPIADGLSKLITATAEEVAKKDAETPIDTEDCGTFVARRGLRVVE